MISIVMGKPGSGKSTYMAIMAQKSLEKGIPVYSTEHIVGTYKLDLSDLNKYNIQDALIIFDESGSKFNSRNWNKFNLDLYTFFCEHRHYNLNIILGVQYWDRLDIVIRELVHNIYVCKRCILNYWFLKVKSIGCQIDISPDEQIIERFFWLPFIVGTKYYYKRNAWKLFDSWEKRDLPTKEFEKW